VKGGQGKRNQAKGKGRKKAKQRHRNNKPKPTQAAKRKHYQQKKPSMALRLVMRLSQKLGGGRNPEEPPSR